MGVAVALVIRVNSVGSQIVFLQKRFVCPAGLAVTKQSGSEPALQESKTTMVARKHTGGLVFILAACLGTVYVFTRSPAKSVEMFSQADLNIIDTAENRDSSPQVTQTAECSKSLSK
jgi:hypothetical protein